MGLQRFDKRMTAPVRRKALIGGLVEFPARIGCGLWQGSRFAASRFTSIRRGGND
jgi:hypothetical protein